MLLFFRGDRNSIKIRLRQLAKQHKGVIPSTILVSIELLAFLSIAGETSGFPPSYPNIVTALALRIDIPCSLFAKHSNSGIVARGGPMPVGRSPTPKYRRKLTEDPCQPLLYRFTNRYTGSSAITKYQIRCERPPKSARKHLESKVPNNAIYREENSWHDSQEEKTIPVRATGKNPDAVSP